MLRVVRASNPSPMTLDGTRTFVVGRERPVVIDPGPDDPAHRDTLLDRLRGATPVAVLLTHAHPDHAGGAVALARALEAPLCMGPGALHSPFPPSAVDGWLADGERVETDAGALRVIATPGHAPEHLAFLWTGPDAPTGGALFVGDLLMGAGDTTLVAPPEGNLRAYLRSLDRVREQGCGVLFPTHGPPLEDPPAALERFRAHRWARIEQVRRVLRDGHPDDAPALVGLIYGAELHPALREAAEGSIRAILRFLREEREAPEEARHTPHLPSP